MTLTLARHLLAILGGFYAMNAAWSAATLHQPLSLDWYGKILLLVLASLLLGLGPELFRLVLSRLAAGPQPSPKQGLSIFTPPVPVSPGKPGGNVDPARQVADLEELAQMTDGDEQLLEQLCVLQDGLFRKRHLNKASK